MTITTNKLALTQSEREILQLISNGYTRIEIARLRGSSIDSVKAHLKHAYIRLEAANSAHAVAICMREGFIE